MTSGAGKERMGEKEGDRGRGEEGEQEGEQDPEGEGHDEREHAGVSVLSGNTQETRCGFAKDMSGS